MTEELTISQASLRRQELDERLFQCQIDALANVTEEMKKMTVKEILQRLLHKD